MTVDELFLFTLEDLEQRVELGRGEYDALMAAWLLRKLVLDQHPLIHEANRSRRLKLRFRMYDNLPDEGVEGWGPGDALYPRPEWGNWKPVVELSLAAFLSRPTLVAFRNVVSVRELIKFL